MGQNPSPPKKRPLEEHAKVLCKEFRASSVVIMAFWPGYHGMASWAVNDRLCKRTVGIMAQLDGQLTPGAEDAELPHPVDFADWPLCADCPDWQREKGNVHGECKWARSSDALSQCCDEMDERLNAEALLRRMDDGQ
jgi:hypothetical protein